MTNLEALREDLLIKQKKGLPFILASCVLWALISVVCALDIPVMTRNMLVFCCACPLFPLAMLVGKIIGVNVLEKENPLSKLLILFTCNQFLYLLIVMWVFNAVPEKMVMIHAMVFGAHLLPYSWTYRSKTYVVVSVVIPLVSLVLGIYAGALPVALFVEAAVIVFAAVLFRESGHTDPEAIA